MSDGTLDGVSRTLSHRGVRGISSHAMTGMANATVERQSCQARTNIVRLPRPSSMTVHAIGSRLRGKFERRGASNPRCSDKRRCLRLANSTNRIKLCLNNEHFARERTRWDIIFYNPAFVYAQLLKYCHDTSDSNGMSRALE